jgi:diguanylate cyclase (GGDEF)-like protein
LFALNLTILILLSVFLYAGLNKILYKNLIKIKNNYQELKKSYDTLLKENGELKINNSDLEKLADRTIALFDITKEICKTLEEDKVFAFFKEQISNYIQVNNCEFLKKNAELAPYRDYIVIPLQIDSHPIGYLVASGVKQEDKDKFHILAQQFILGLKRALLYQRVQELAITDSLTEVYSRRYFLERLKEELEHTKKQKSRFSFLMLDIDHFKDYNDRYGHLVGDSLLKEISRIIKENTREIDAVGKYGGDEFALILSETDKAQAEFVAERIRKLIEAKAIRAYDEDLKITASIGIAAYPDDAKRASSLIEKADRALYQSKQAGRNRVSVFHK